MKIDIEILSSLTHYHGLRPEWNALVAENSSHLSGLDGTSTYEWFEAIVSAFSEAAQSRVIVARSGAELLGILPLIINRAGRLGPRLLAATELYGGRNGPLLKDDRADVCAALLRGLDLACPGWVSLQMTLLAHSANALAVVAGGKSNGYCGSTGPIMESPFFPLLDSDEAFRRGYPKSVQQSLRRANNKISKIGSLRFLEFVHDDEADKLLEHILRIERQSWKHEAGSAITTQPRQEAFYRALFPRAMKHELLYGAVLMLQDEPIAYNFGLCHQQVFSCLKHSHVQSFDKLTPSYLLHDFLFQRLRSRGVVTYDWMGLPDPHKLRWSDHNSSYQRNSWTFFNRSLKARAYAFSCQQKQRLSQLRSRFVGSQWVASA